MQTLAHSHTLSEAHARPHLQQTVDCAPEVPIDVPLKALIKFSQSNQIILKSLSLSLSLSPTPGLVPEPSRQVSKAGAPRAAESLQHEHLQRRARPCEEREQVGHAEGRQTARLATVQRLHDAQLECIIASVEQ
jgi:hypothetical protein